MAKFIALTDKDWIVRHYVELEMSAQAIAKMLGASNHTVRGWLIKHGVHVRGKRECRHTRTFQENYSGPKNPSWRGGERRSNGRILIKVSKHYPGADRWGYVARARFIVGKHLGRYLNSKEHIHHINRQKDDDRIENLMLCDAKSHAELHAREDGPNKGRFKKGNVPWNASGVSIMANGNSGKEGT